MKYDKTAKYIDIWMTSTKIPTLNTHVNNSDLCIISQEMKYNEINENENT